jgi:hypothetical protein
MILAVTGAAGRPARRSGENPGVGRGRYHKATRCCLCRGNLSRDMALWNEAGAGQLEDRAIAVCAAL